MTKTSHDNNLNYINFSKHFHEYLTEMPLFEVVNGNSPLLDTF